MKRRQLGGKLIGFTSGVVFAAFGGDGISALVVEASIIKRARPMHFCSTNVGVPVGHRPEPCPGVQVDSSQTVGRRNKCAGPLSVGSEPLPVLVELGIK